MSRIRHWLAFHPLTVQIAFAAAVLGLASLAHNPNPLDGLNVTFAFIAAFGGYLVARTIQYRYVQQHRPATRSDAEIAAIVDQRLAEARATLTPHHGAASVSTILRTPPTAG